MDKQYICISCGRAYTEDELDKCPCCGELSCHSCSGEVSTIEEYDEAMKAND